MGYDPVADPGQARRWFAGFSRADLYQQELPAVLYPGRIDLQPGIYPGWNRHRPVGSATTDGWLPAGNRSANLWTGDVVRQIPGLPTDVGHHVDGHQLDLDRDRYVSFVIQVKYL